MHVLLVSQHYWPETVGTARRAQLIGEFLAARGHQVDVLCGWPNHPSMAHQFNTGHDRTEDHHGVHIHRVPVYRTSPRLTATSLAAREPAGTAAVVPPLAPLARAHRLATYGTWLARGALDAFLHRGRWEVVVAISPLPTGLVGALFVLRHRLPLVFDLQDIWPDAAVQAGILTGPTLIRAMEHLEFWTYRQSRALVVLSAGFGKNLEAKGVPEERIQVIPNAVDLAPHLKADGTGIRLEWGLSPADTLVIYTGNLGLMQDLDVLLDAAGELRHVRQIRFLIVGGGVDRERLLRRAEARGLAQVRFLGPQPAERIPALLAAADVCFLSLRRDAYTPDTIPSKLYEYLAAGRPVLNLVTGDTARTLDTAQAGINLPPGDAAALRVAIFALHADPGLRQKLGAAGRRYVTLEASIEVVGSRYEALLRHVLSPDGPL